MSGKAPPTCNTAAAQHQHPAQQHMQHHPGSSATATRLTTRTSLHPRARETFPHNHHSAAATNTLPCHPGGNPTRTATYPTESATETVHQHPNIIAPQQSRLLLKNHTANHAIDCCPHPPLLLLKQDTSGDCSSSSSDNAYCCLRVLHQPRWHSTWWCCPAPIAYSTTTRGRPTQPRACCSCCWYCCRTCPGCCCPCCCILWQHRPPLLHAAVLISPHQPHVRLLLLGLTGARGTVGICPSCCCWWCCSWRQASCCCCCWWPRCHREERLSRLRGPASNREQGRTRGTTCTQGCSTHQHVTHTDSFGPCLHTWCASGYIMKTDCCVAIKINKAQSAGSLAPPKHTHRLPQV